MRYIQKGLGGKHDRQRHAIRNIDMAIQLLADNQHQIERDIQNDERTQWTRVENELRVARRLIIDGYKEEFDPEPWWNTKD